MPYLDVALAEISHTACNAHVLNIYYLVAPGLVYFQIYICSSRRCRYHWGSLFCAPYIGNFVWLDLDVMLALSFDILIVSVVVMYTYGAPVLQDHLPTLC